MESKFSVGEEVLVYSLDHPNIQGFETTITKIEYGIWELRGEEVEGYGYYLSPSPVDDDNSWDSAALRKKHKGNCIMRESVKIKWLGYLRGGEFKQTKSTLKDSEGFCCLGVLCQLHADMHPDGCDLGFHENGSGGFSYLGVPGTLPPQVQEWAGIGHTNPEVVVNRKGRDLSLAMLNDSGFTFDQIADVIEYEL